MSYFKFEIWHNKVESKVYEKLDEWQISGLDERCDIIHVVLKLNILDFSKPNDYKGNKKTPKKRRNEATISWSIAWRNY